MMFIFNKSLFNYIFIACVVSEICCDPQVLHQYSESKELVTVAQNRALAVTTSSVLNVEVPLKSIKSNAIVTRRRKRKRRKKKIQPDGPPINVVLPVKPQASTDNSIDISFKRPRRRRINPRKRNGKRRPSNKSSIIRGLTSSTLKRKNITSHKSPSLLLETTKLKNLLETKSLVLPVVPTNFPLKKNKSNKAKKSEIKNSRCGKNNGGCAHVCLLKGIKKCQCVKGFRLAEDDKNCVDINECSIKNNGCQMNCINTIGSYRCDCPRGFRLSLDWKSCEDINECLLRNGHGPCQDTCENTYGGYRCNCNGLEGTKLGNDLHSCVDVDECSKGNGGCSHICINTFGRSFCSCPEGLELLLDFKTCTESPRIFI